MQTLNEPDDTLIEIINFPYLQKLIENKKIDNSFYYFLTNLISLDYYLKSLKSNNL